MVSEEGTYIYSVAAAAYAARKSLWVHSVLGEWDFGTGDDWERHLLECCDGDIQKRMRSMPHIWEPVSVGSDSIVEAVIKNGSGAQGEGHAYETFGN